MHTQRLMAVRSPWPVSNLTMYGTPPICTVIFGTSNDVESAKMSLLAKSHAQFACLVAWQIL